MSMKFMRKSAVAVAATALLGGGLAIGVGQGVANAYDAETCTTSAERSYSNVGSLGTKYHLSKEVEGDGKVGANGTVSFMIKGSGAGALINEMRDFQPEGFELIKAELSVNWLIGGQKWENVTNKVTRQGGAISIKGDGWTTASGKIVALRTTYRVPSNVLPGQKINAGGAGFNVVLADGNHNWEDMNLCLTGRIPNPVEIGSGALGSLGLGSIVDMGTGVTGSLTDPSSPLGRLSDSLGG